MLKTRPTGQGRMPKFPGPGNLTFSGGGETLKKWTENFMKQFQSPGPSFPEGFTPQVIRHHGPKVGRKCDRVREGETLTCKQNASMTVGKSRPHPLQYNVVCLLATAEDVDLICNVLNCILLVLLSLIWSASFQLLLRPALWTECILSPLLSMIWTVFDCYF